CRPSSRTRSSAPVLAIRDAAGWRCARWTTPAGARRARARACCCRCSTRCPTRSARARRMIADYDPASVAATTRFLLEGGQPFERGEALAAIDAPAIVVPGIDPTHPPEVADVDRRHL